jgi:hypothetical protein
MALFIVTAVGTSISILLEYLILILQVTGMPDFVLNLETFSFYELLEFSRYEFDIVSLVMPQYYAGFSILLKKFIMTNENSIENLPRL